GRTVGDFFFNDFCSTPSCARKIGPFPTFELLTPSPTAVSTYSITSTVDTGAIVTEEISAKDILVTDNAIGDHSKHVDEGVSVSSPKDGQLIVADAGATGSTPEVLEDDQTNKIQNDDDVPSEKSSEHTPSPKVFVPTGDFGEILPIVTPLKVQRPHDDGSYSSIDRSARIPDVAIPEYIPQNTPKKVKEYIDLVEEEIDVDDSHLESLISDIEKSIENYSSTYEDIKKEFGEEVGKNVIEDVGSTKMKQVSVDNEEKEIADDKNQLKAESSEELRHNLECSVLLDIVNPANPYMHMLVLIFSIEEKKKILELPEDLEKKKEKIESIIAEKVIDLEKAKDNPCYDTMKAEWLKDKQKMTYGESAFFADKCRQSMSEWRKCFQTTRRGFDGLHHWNRRTIPFTWRSNQNDFGCGVYCIKAMEWYDGWNEKKHPITTLSTQKKRKDKEKHLENLRVKRVEKVFVEDEKIKKERERHEQ
ncbi:60 kDa heat shock protein mitochondrial, partial [Bienertia sinuspersici]